MSDLDSLQPADLELHHGIRILLEVDAAGEKASSWAERHQSTIRRLLRDNGALLIRGLRIPSSRLFGEVLTTLFGEELVQYQYRSTPRTELRGNVYTATEYHADQVIPQHNENAYSNQWPTRIGFLCVQPAESGGATPIGDSRLIYDRLPPAVRERFERKGVLYVRNFSDIDLPWTEVFQTDDRQQVERYCLDNDIAFEWLPNNGLRTRQVNPAVIEHPVSGDKLWFNQAHLYHPSNLDPAVERSLREVMGEVELPKNTYYGDGSPIDRDDLQLIRDLYERTKVAFPWQKNDLMLLDNMLYTHGREAYSGSRQVLVGMAGVRRHPRRCGVDRPASAATSLRSVSAAPA